jgi:hypothetical protein
MLISKTELANSGQKIHRQTNNSAKGITYQPKNSLA